MIDQFGISFVIYFLMVFFGLASAWFLWVGFTVENRVPLELRKGKTHTEPERSLAFSEGSGLKHPNAGFFYDVVSGNRELAAKSLINGSELTRTAARIGISNIEYLTKLVASAHAQVPYLFGVNKGGALVATYLAHRMSLAEKYLVKCDWNVVTEREYIENREVDGPILILDDVSKSGNTLVSIRKCVQERYPNASIYCMVLVVSHCGDDDDSIAGIQRTIDYYSWHTPEKGIKLPWSVDARNSLDVSEYFSDNEMDQVGGRLQLVEKS